jgi:hypothetical protein
MCFYPKKHITSNLEKDGYVVLPTTENINAVLNSIPSSDYVFLDYKYTIKATVLPTFHRDVTSGQRYCETKYPTYTAIQYDFDGDFLSVCPNSHAHYPFTLTRPHNISGAKSTIVLFNADMLHAGMPNKVGDIRIAHQYKIVHKDDVQYMSHIQGIQVTKNEKEQIHPLLVWFLRHCSFHGAFFVSIMLPSCLKKRHSSGFIHYLQNLVPLSFYNNV